MEKEKIKTAIVKLYNGFERICMFVLDVITIILMVSLGTIGFCICNLAAVYLQAFNESSLPACSPELSMLMVIVCMLGLLMGVLPFGYLSLYWRKAE